MKMRIWRFITDPYYPSARGRKKLRGAVLCSLGIALMVGFAALYALGPIFALAATAMLQRKLTYAMPIPVKTKEEAQVLIDFYTILVSWRWVLLLLCTPLAWTAARGSLLWTRLFAAIVVTFVCALIYFEALKTNHMLEAMQTNWSGRLSAPALDKLSDLLFWFEGWQIAIGVIALGLMASLVAALVADRNDA